MGCQQPVHHWYRRGVLLCDRLVPADQGRSVLPPVIDFTFASQKFAHRSAGLARKADVMIFP